MATATGCSSMQRYTASSIPPELQAGPVSNAQTIDLSRFAGPLVDKDRIDHGDVLKVSLAAGLEADDVSELLVRVGEDGRATLPELGPVLLAGLRLEQAEQQIIRACIERGLYRQPLVTVAMEQPRVNRVTVVGGVEKPGVVELPRNSSYLLSAIVAAGGLSEEAGTKVEIKHPAAPGRLVSYEEGGGAPAAAAIHRVCFDLADTDADSDAGTQPHDNHYLEDGSVVIIEKRQPEPVRVIGLVKHPGQFDFPIGHELRVLDALAEAQGPTTTLANELRVIRKTADGKGQITIRLTIRSAKRNVEENLRLAPGDVVSVEETPLTFVEGVLNRVVRMTVGGTMGLF